MILYSLYNFATDLYVLRLPLSLVQITILIFLFSFMATLNFPENLDSAIGIRFLMAIAFVGYHWYPFLWCGSIFNIENDVYIIFRDYTIATL